MQFIKAKFSLNFQEDLFDIIDFDQNYQIIVTTTMSKKTMAQQILQKLKEKKDIQQKARPHYQIYRLSATFAFQFHKEIKDQIVRLNNQLSKAKQTRDLFDSHLQEFENTGKQNFPRIVVKPQFIASDNITPVIKDFYRKSSNSFLKVDLIRNKKYLESFAKITVLFQKLQSMKSHEEVIRNLTEKQRKTNNEKRMKVLQQDLRLRDIRKQQKHLRELIAEDRHNNRQLINQYEIKKGNLQSRKDRLKTVLSQIQTYKNQIEESFNPIAYRQHLRTIFGVGIKNEFILKNLEAVQTRVSKLEKQKQSLEKICQKANSIFKLGRTSDSPSLRKRANKNIEERKYAFFDGSKRDKSKTQKSLDRSKNISQNSTLKSVFEIDSLKSHLTSKRTSYLTSERSFHNKNKSDFFNK